MLELKESNLNHVPQRGFSLFRFLSKFSKLNWLLVIIPMLYMFVMVFFPMIRLFKLSFFDDSGFTMEYISTVFTSPVYLQVILLTFKVAIIVTIVSLFLAYPVSYLLVQIESARWKKVVFSAVLIPFWISLLVRTFSWNILLSDQGVINKTLMSIGIINEPLALMYNTTGVVIGMTHVLIPYMILSLYAVMGGIDRNLLLAAEGLGARPSRAFLDVFLPLSLPGILSGSLLVFVLSLGFYVTPALLGSANNMTVPMLIENNINVTLNWHLASAISFALLFLTLLLILIPVILFRKHPLVKDVL
ncbi:ABC transporter permease [Bacillus massiliigorillae]|uniref:ABC transporter permease n=1 Tax=Bacillus massiliigorillae TaxID=1243664 RepID=UPI00039C78FA|nr:ABC transporter permease [Bacillus massiliigorillae]